ncbi:MAG: hypothetical protein IPN94_07310 [Sphingobacteriales bacterium]|nr:hypothetical protein [Sphingobacteriales bacterium]
MVRIIVPHLAQKLSSSMVTCMSILLLASTVMFLFFDFRARVSLSVPGFGKTSR